MECSCSCYLDGAIAWNCYKRVIRTARKEHKCYECGDTIKKGEQYYVHTGLADGDWMRVKNCSICERIRDDYGCGIIGDLDAVLIECIGIGVR